MRVASTLIIASFFALAGCGGDDGNGTSEAPSETFAIVASDFTFSPPTFAITEAGTYTFDVTNDGGVDHALEIEGSDLEQETETIGPGESASLTVDLESGTYELYCPIGNHRDLGMSGEISVG